METTVKLRHLKMAPRKVRLVGSLIRGMHVNQALAELINRHKRASEPIVKLLKSGIASAREKGMEETALFVKTIRVDQASMVKRVLPAAMGRGHMMQKKMSHIILTLEDNKPQKARFNIMSKVKVKKEVSTTLTNKKEISPKDNSESVKAKIAESTNQGVVKKIFRRKSI